MWRGHSRVGLTHVWRGHSRVRATHVWRGIHVWDLLTCGGDIPVWELLTCETSHQSEILHSLIFLPFCAFVRVCMCVCMFV